MPTLYFPCPQCDRPLDADPSLDGPEVVCPCCDRRVAVPNPRALGRPIFVWLVATLTLLVPASWIPALLHVGQFLPQGTDYGVPAAVALGTLVCLIPAIALFRGRRTGWGGALTVGCVSLSIGLVAFTFGMPFMMIAGLDPLVFLHGLLIALVAGGLSGLLFLPIVRAWCDR